MEKTLKKFKIIFKEVTVQETVYCVSVNASSEDEAFIKATDGRYSTREVLYDKTLDILNKQVIATTNE